MKTGQLITSFLQGKANQTMTSTTSNRYAAAVTVGSKTGYYNASPGAILGIARGRVKTEGGTDWAGDRRILLSLRRRPRPKHKGTWVRYGWRAQLLWMRLTWRSHWRPSVVKKIALIKNFGRN